MITQLRLKNWRSLRDVTIDDLQPINVFIGANSSGKTNILDALYFIREMFDRDVVQAVSSRGDGDKIRFFGASSDEVVEIEFTCQLVGSSLTWSTSAIFKPQPYKFRLKRTLMENNNVVFSDPVEMLTVNGSNLSNPLDLGIDLDIDARLLLSRFRSYVTTRWQMLDGNFVPPLGRETSKRGSPVVIDRCADNLIFMLDYMQETHPDLYKELQNDVRYLLNHVSHLRTEQDEHEARLLVHEVSYPDKVAPTVSFGTARIFAMLMANYALDMYSTNLPGLVVIEEPDTALNPGLLKNFVELLREYVSREEPRQFILTTHNPAFLNYFKPEEVRIVSRDEHGYTTVNRVPEYIKDIWLDEHGLGEVWLTNAFGGVPE